MYPYPSLDDYDLIGIRPEEAALWGPEVLAGVEALEDVWLTDADLFV
ncbi:hypothetical protein ABT096_29560 [Streptomyces sp. NPDC002561]